MHRKKIAALYGKEETLWLLRHGECKDVYPTRPSTESIPNARQGHMQCLAVLKIVLIIICPRL